jgi:putative DNA primase/helicase
VRFDHRRGAWLVFREHHWTPDADARVRRLAKASIRERQQAALRIQDDTDRQRAVKWALGSESRTRLDALLTLAQAEPGIADPGTDWDATPLLLGCPNGVLDLTTGTLRPGAPADRITLATSVPYDPAATCPRWRRFVPEVLADDADLIAFMQRAMGYSLTGLTVEQVLFLCYGIGSNGKGTLLNTMRAVLGSYGHATGFSTLELNQRSGIPNDLAALVGRRFVVASETNDGTRLNEARVKMLTGGDPVSARFLHSEFFEFTPAAKFWLAVNHKPVVRDDSHGFWRRIRLIPFTRTFPVNPNLDRELHAERPGILVWAVEGCRAWQAEGLAAPGVVTDATAEYQADSDTLREFIEEACEMDAAAEVHAGDLYAHYKQWTERRGWGDRERLTATTFGRRMAERFPRRDGARRVYRGLARRNLRGSSEGFWARSEGLWVKPLSSSMRVSTRETWI